jgi:hypothetical protein
MVRYVVTNLRFPEQTYRELRYAALRRGVSVASVVRESVDRYLGRGDEEEPIPFGEDPVDKWVGAFHGGPGDESINHDHYLYGWPKETEDETPRRHERVDRALSPGRKKSSKSGKLRAPKTRAPVRTHRANPRRARDETARPGGSGPSRRGGSRRPEK